VPEQAVTLETVAERARVSRQTVSNVLRHPSRVAEPTRERVLAVIRESGYRPSLPARQLATRRAHAVAVRADRLRDGISGLVLDAFYHGLAEAGYAAGLRVVLYPQQSDSATEMALVEELLGSSAADAVVLTATGEDDDRAEHLQAAGATFCAFGRPWHEGGVDHDWVDVDGADGTAQAVRHLLERGHRHVAWIGWPENAELRGTGTDRQRGWREELDRHEVPAPRTEAHVVNDTDAAEAAVRALLEGSAPPDAVVCASDTLALGAHRAALSTGRPLGVVGFDATPVAAALGLPSVAQPVDDAARHCIRMLSARLAGDGASRPAEHVLLRPSLNVPTRT
jgi:DNA-binding LacI/PurR family transcriptional regulator